MMSTLGGGGRASGEAGPETTRGGNSNGGRSLALAARTRAPKAIDAFLRRASKLLAQARRRARHQRTRTNCEQRRCGSRSSLSDRVRASLLENETMNLIYVGDPMCSWCYGFAKPLDELLADPQGAAPLQLALLMGGLRPFTTEPMALARADELAGHWHHVEQASGQPFTQAPHTAMHRPGFVYDTEPASRATVTVRSRWPQQVWRYFKAVQHAFYAEGRDVTE
ncbi:MAG: hypothetical protein KGK18_03120, partial [Burkholderiales bacterium]|nr:hypothetical protein [Burkholderiales bacterium]